MVMSSFPLGLRMSRFTSTENQSGRTDTHPGKIDSHAHPGAGRDLFRRAGDRGGCAASGRRGDVVRPGADRRRAVPGVRRLTGDRDTGDYAALRDGRSVAKIMWRSDGDRVAAG